MNIFIIGFFLGMTHAFDADHLLSVGSMVKQEMSAKRLTSLGLFWGLGHTLTLLVLTLLLILFQVLVSPTISMVLEFMVGFMLVVIGIGVYRKINNRHVPNTKLGVKAKTKNSRNQVQSFLIGMLHGGAGASAILALLLVASHDDITKILYVFFFGIGSLAGMATVTFGISLPLKKIVKLNNQMFQSIYYYSRYGLSLVTIGFGAYIMVEAGSVLGSTL